VEWNWGGGGVYVLSFSGDVLRVAGVGDHVLSCLSGFAFQSTFLILKKKKSRLMRSRCCLCIPLINF
jgi:hypothetical protein